MANPNPFGDTPIQEATAPKTNPFGDAPVQPEQEPTEIQQDAAENYATGGGKDLGDRIADSWDWFTGGQGLSNLDSRIWDAGADFMKAGYGYAEMFAEMVSGLAGSAVGTIGGAVTEAHTAFADPNYKPGEAFMSVYTPAVDKLTVRPVSAAGQQLEKIVGVPFQYMAEKGELWGDNTYQWALQKGYSAQVASGLAAAVRTSTEGALYVVPYLGGKGALRAKGYLENKANNRLLAEKEAANIQYESRQKTLDAQEKADLEIKMRINANKRYAEVSAEHKGIKGAPLAEKAPRSGAEILVTPSDAIPLTEYVSNWRVANGISQTKKLKKETMTAIESEYNDYKSRVNMIAEAQYARALAELKGEQFKPLAPDDIPNPGYVAHIRSKVRAMEKQEAALAKAKETFGEYVAKEQKITEEARVYEEVQRTWQERKIMEEEMAWAEKGITDAEARTEVLLQRSVMPLRTSIDEAIVAYGGRIGRQRGAVDPTVFAEGLIKAGKKGVEFTERMVREYGEQWRTIAPMVYGTLSEKMATQPGSPISDKHFSPKISEKLIKDTMWDRVNKPGAVVSETIEVIGGQAITKLRRKARNNPYFKDILDDIERPQTTAVGEITKPDLTNAYHTGTGKLISRVEDAIERVGSQIAPRLRHLGGKMSKASNASILKYLRMPRAEFEAILELKKGDKHVRAAAEIRSVFNDVQKMAREVGIKVGHLDGYFPRIYDWSKIRKMKDQFMEAITPYVQDRLIREGIYDHIVEREGILLPESRANRNAFLNEGKGPRKASNLEMERQLDFIPDHILEPFLEDNVFAVSAKYIENGIGRIEAARRFGANEEILIDKLNKAVEYSDKIGEPITRLEVQRLFDIVDASQRSWKVIHSPTGRRLTRGTVTVMNAVTLPLALFTSMPEALIPLYHGGAMAYAKALPATVATTLSNMGRTIYKGLPKSEAQWFAEQMLKSSDLAATERISAMYNGEVNAINSAIFQANFLHQWTKTMNILSIHTFQRMAKQFLQAEAKARGGKRWWNKAEHARMEKLVNSMGMDVNEGIAWVKRGMPKKGDAFYEGQYMQAATNFVHLNVMTSRAAVRPMWHSIPHLAPIAHLKGFPAMFGNIVMKQMYHDTLGEFRAKRYYNGTRNTAYAIATGWAMYQMADIAFDIKDRIKYGKELPPARLAEKPVDRFMRIADAAGFFGGMSTPHAGLQAKTQWGGTAWMAMLGPSVAKTGELLDGFSVGKSGRGWRQFARALAASTPGGNVNKKVQKTMTDNIEEFMNNVYPPDDRDKTWELTNDSWGQL